MPLPPDIRKLQSKLQSDLPGEQAHLEMLPYREATSKMLATVPEFRESAVAILLFHQAEELCSVLIQRPNYMGSHSGQIAFPGGRRDETDPDLIHTALREMHEEIGFIDPQIQHLGELTKIYIPVSKFLVYPNIFYTHVEPNFKPNPREVEDIITFPLGQICEPDCLTTTNITMDRGVIMKNIPCFMINQKVVWGATALMMNELRMIIENGN
jgi:8-oxo-dGTP pyrophosphatase MutT (NUDIX family)